MTLFSLGLELTRSLTPFCLLSSQVRSSCLPQYPWRVHNRGVLSGFHDYKTPRAHLRANPVVPRTPSNQSLQTSSSQLSSPPSEAAARLMHKPLPMPPFAGPKFISSQQPRILNALPQDQDRRI